MFFLVLYSGVRCSEIAGAWARLGHEKIFFLSVRMRRTLMTCVFVLFVLLLSVLSVLSVFFSHTHPLTPFFSYLALFILLML